MTAPIDYSRPVGWWCPVCTRCALLDRADDLIKLGLLNCCPSLPVIPRYLPIPEGQRPLVEDEVEEAEVVTVNVGGIIDWLNSDGTRWTTDPTVEHINYIVTGATE